MTIPTIPLGGGGGDSNPSIQLMDVGDEIVVALVDFNNDTVQQKHFESGALLTWDDGKPKYSTIITVMVVDPRTGAAGSWTSNTPAEEGQILTIWADAGRHTDWKSGLTEFKDKVGRGFQVGDMLHLKRLADEPARKAGMNPRKVWRFTLAEPTDSAVVEKAVAAHHEHRSAMAGPPQLDPATGLADGEDPF